MVAVTGKGEGIPSVGSDSATSVTFLLLVFFLVAASVSASHNLTELLPPPPRRRGSSAASGVGRHGVLRICLGGSSTLVYKGSCVKISRLERGTGRFVTGIGGTRGVPRGARGGIRFFNACVIGSGRMVSLRGSHKSSCRTCVDIRGRLITTCGRLESRLTARGFKIGCSRLDSRRRGTIHRVCPRQVSRTRPGGCKRGG